jgi:dUTP pyrophosphatase
MFYTKTKDVKDPNRGTEGSAGIDFYIPNEVQPITLGPGESCNIPSGIKVLIPYGYAGIFFNKSGVAIKGLNVGACVVDSDYRGEVHLNLHNVSNLNITINPGQKIVQMLIQPVNMSSVICITEEQYNMQPSTERGTGGFGSTGSN